MKRFGLAMAAMILGSAAWSMPGGHGMKDHASGGCAMQGKDQPAAQNHRGHGPMRQGGMGHGMMGHGMRGHANAEAWAPAGEGDSAKPQRRHQ